jgi:hypothetical protein
MHIVDKYADLIDYWVVECACSVNLTTFQSDFHDFQPPSRVSALGGVGVHVKGNIIVRVHCTSLTRAVTPASIGAMAHLFARPSRPSLPHVDQSSGLYPPLPAPQSSPLPS